MNTKQLIFIAISFCSTAAYLNAMQPIEQPPVREPQDRQGRETDAQKARRLRRLAEPASVQAVAPISAEEWEREKQLTARYIVELLDADEAESRMLQEAQDEATARMLDEELRNQRTLKQMAATDALLARIRTEEAAERARHDAVLAAAIAEQLQAQDREDQERASLETALRLQDEWNNT